MTDDDRVTLTVTINGTAENPWTRYGLARNPFPQLGKHEWAAAERMVASLDGVPVRSAQDIRDRLPGFSDEFVELCIRNYRPGERVRFDVFWRE